MIDYKKAFTQFGSTVKGIIDSEHRMDCPFCGKEKFYFNIESGLWDCKTCTEAGGGKGNLTVFLRKIASLFAKEIPKERIKALSSWKGVSEAAIKECGIGWNGDRYTTPCRQSIVLCRHRGSPIQCYGGTASFMQCGKDTNKIWIVEGWSDFIAMVQILRENKINDRVLAVPGSGHPKNLNELIGKHIVLLMDNDKQGVRGTERLLGNLSESTVTIINWPNNCEHKDVRDILNSKGSKEAFEFINKNLGKKKDSPKPSEGEDDEKTDTSPEAVVEFYRKWLHLPQKEVLDVLFGTIFANKMDLDPLWLFIVGPPGSCKTELIMSLDSSSKVECITRITPRTLVSGVRSMGEDPSLLPKLDGRILSIKDFTAILSMNSLSRDEIFGQLRDAYDGKTDFGYGTGKKHFKAKFGIVAGVTPDIEKYLSSSLGERFIKFYIRDSRMIDSVDELLGRALGNLGKGTRMREELSAFGRKVIARKIEQVPTISSDLIDKIKALAKFTAYLRGAVKREKYSGMLEFKPTREVPTRLARQFACLGLGITAYYNLSTIPDWVHKTLVRIAIDTCPDRIEEIVRKMYFAKETGPLSTKDIVELTKFPYTTVNYILQDLVLLRIILKKEINLWQLSPSIIDMIEQGEVYIGRR